jgi:small-conductance mechanosensitive channel
MLEGIGVSWPTYEDWIIGGAALAIAAVAWFAAYFAGRWLGGRLARIWAERAGARGEELLPRLCSVSRWLIAALLLAIVFNADTWRPLGAMVLGLALALAAGLLVWQLVRGLNMPRWGSALLAAAAGLALLARAVGGLEPITHALDEIGLTAAKHRVSLLTVVQFGVTIVALYAVAKLLNRVAGHSIGRATSLDPTQRLLAQKLAGIVIVVVAFFVGIDILGIDLTALAVFSGALGLAVGFGLQKTFGNLIAGIILLMDRSVKPGDVIAVGDSFGTVNKIGVRAVSVVTRDGKEHLIPNELLMTQEVENWSYSSRDVRVRIPVGISYDSDIQLAQQLMLQAIGECQRVLKSPAPRVWLRAFGENAVEHEIRIWITDPEAGIGSVQSEVLNRLWVLFRENGIVLPYPQREIRIKEWPGAPPARPAGSADPTHRRDESQDPASG